MENQNPAQVQNPVSQPVIKPPTKPKQQISKWIIVILILFLIIAVGIIAYLLNKNATPNTKNLVTATATPISSPSAEWNTYKNIKYNYSIDYPGNWTFIETQEAKGGRFYDAATGTNNPDARDAISMNVGQKNGDYWDTPLEEYAKVAANKEIENYNSLATIKKITTSDGIIGYETTWMVQGRTINGKPPEGKGSESSPITYFEIPNNKELLFRISLSKIENLDIYEKMLKTFKISPLQLQPMPTPTPTITIDETSLLVAMIKETFIAKNGGDGSTLNITVSKIDGNYAQGMLSGTGGGGMWFAAKVNGVWKEVWSGNGVILCSDLTSYPDFPKNMISECYDDKIQDSVKR